MRKLKLETPRSFCPVSGCLEIIGDRWTLLIIRDLALGATRFKEFAGAPEGVPTNILTDRLNRLLEYGLIEQKPLSESSKRMGYALTDRGSELLPILGAVRDWGLKHISGTRLPTTEETAKRT